MYPKPIEILFLRLFVKWTLLKLVLLLSLKYTVFYCYAFYSNF